MLCDKNEKLWAAELLRLGTNLIQAITDAQPRQIRLAFRDYRHYATICFHQIDVDLAALQTIIDIQRLAFAAQSLTRSTPETALLLAYEAAHRDDNLITEQALRDLLEQLHWAPIPQYGHTAPVLCVATSPDSQQIATGSQDGTTRLWDRQGGPLAVLEGAQGRSAASRSAPIAGRSPPARRMAPRACGIAGVGCWRCWKGIQQGSPASQ